MNTQLRVNVGITNGAPIRLELEPVGGGEARVWLYEDAKLKGYATVYLNDLLVATRSLLMLEAAGS